MAKLPPATAGSVMPGVTGERGEREFAAGHRKGIGAEWRRKDRRP